MTSLQQDNAPTVMPRMPESVAGLTQTSGGMAVSAAAAVSSAATSSHPSNTASQSHKVSEDGLSGSSNLADGSAAVTNAESHVSHPSNAGDPLLNGAKKKHRRRKNKPADAQHALQGYQSEVGSSGSAGSAGERVDAAVQSDRVRTSNGAPRHNASSSNRRGRKHTGRNHGAAVNAGRGSRGELFPVGTYKTEICRSHFGLGYCEYGEECQFAHGVQELRPRNFDIKYKTQLCKNFHNSGLCRFGSRCKFIHDEHRVQVNPNEFWLVSPSDNLVRVEIVNNERRREQLMELAQSPPPAPPMAPGMSHDHHQQITQIVAQRVATARLAAQARGGGGGSDGKTADGKEEVKGDQKDSIPAAGTGKTSNKGEDDRGSPALQALYTGSMAQFNPLVPPESNPSGGTEAMRQQQLQELAVQHQLQQMRHVQHMQQVQLQKQQEQQSRLSFQHSPQGSHMHPHHQQLQQQHLLQMHYQQLHLQQQQQQHLLQGSEHFIQDGQQGMALPRGSPYSFAIHPYYDAAAQQQHMYLQEHFQGHGVAYEQAPSAPADSVND